MSYTFLSRKGRNVSFPEYWTPLFDGLVFNEASYPANRLNKSFEIRGLTIFEGSITNAVGTFTFNNGDVAVFNSRGVLVEILGDTDNQGVGGASFIETWTPLSLPGYDIQLYQTGPSVPTLSNDNHTVTVTDNTVYVTTQAIFSSPNINDTKYAINFTLGDPVNITAGGIYLGLWKEINIETTNPVMGVFFVLAPINGVYNLTFVSDFVSELNSVDLELNPIAIPWTANTEFIVAIDPTVGTYGTMYLYTSSDLINPIYSYPIAVNYPDPDASLSVISMGLNSTAIVNVINNPQYILPGFTYVGGGGFDTNSLPVNRAGNGYTVSGLVGTVFVPGYGDAVNGDLVLFDNAGVIKGKVWTRQEIESIITEEGKIGMLPWIPIEDAVSSTPLGKLMVSYPDPLSGSIINTIDNFNRTIDITTTSGGAYEVIGASDFLFKTPTVTTRGIVFKFPDYTDVNNNFIALQQGKLRIGFGRDYYTTHASIDFNERYHLECNINDTGISVPKLVYVLDAETATETAITGVTFNAVDEYEIAISNTTLYIKNITTDEIFSVNFSAGNPTFPSYKRFVYAISHTGNGGHPLPVVVKASVISVATSPASYEYPIMADLIPNGQLDLLSLPPSRKNRTYQIQGIDNNNSNTLIWPSVVHGQYDITLHNGDIVGFNSEYDLVAHLSNYNIPHI